MVSLSKSKLRKLISEKFRSLPEDELRQCGERLSKNLFHLISQLFSNEDFIFGAYAPLDDEVAWELSFESSMNKASFPGCQNGVMEFMKCRLDELVIADDFNLGKRKILCPPKSATRVLPNVLFIPGRAFTVNGDRLGRGKGFYDRYLKEFEGIKIGICLEMQIVDELPIEEFDLPVDYIVTESRVINAFK